MTLDTWLLFVALSVLPAFSPGPGLLYTLSNSLRYGSHITIWSTLGNTLGMIVLGIGVTFGLGALMAASSYAFMALKIIGGMYLVWLGIKTWRDRSALQTLSSASTTPKKRSIFLTALGVAVTNPKAIAVLLAIIPPFLSDPATVHRDGIIMAVTYAATCLVSHLSVMLLSGRIRGFFANALRMKYLRRGIGLTFIGFGAALATASR